mgnify:CR=1 FL=1
MKSEKDASARELRDPSNDGELFAYGPLFSSTTLSNAFGILGDMFCLPRQIL